MTTAEEVYAAFEHNIENFMSHEMRPPGDAYVKPPKPGVIPKVYWWHHVREDQSEFAFWAVTKTARDMANAYRKVANAIASVHLQFMTIHDEAYPFCILLVTKNF